MLPIPLLFVTLSFSSPKIISPPSSIETNSIQDSVRSNAFRVLEEKCNICHTTKRRVQNFTLKNMDSLVTEINSQVFIKEKMPKGKNNVLTEKEKNNLRTWINTLPK